MTIGLSILRNAVRSPDSTAIFGSSNLTYGQLNIRTNKIAHYLNSTLKKGDRVALFVANRPEVVEVVGGVANVHCQVGVCHFSYWHKTGCGSARFMLILYHSARYNPIHHMCAS